MTMVMPPCSAENNYLSRSPSPQLKRKRPGGRLAAHARCVGCGSAITDQYILRVAPDLEWHAACLRCSECDLQLDEASTCFLRHGKPYCKTDYLRLFGTKCAKCGLGFNKNDFMMRARALRYHMDCFRCVGCGRQLIPGEEFSLREEGLHCKADTEAALEKAAAEESSLELRELRELREEGSTSPSNNNDPCIGDHNSPSPEPNEVITERRHGSGSGKRGDKTTRVRTVLNEKQLHTLRTCYGANPRPDALMKEQLVEMTGLSPRVIRVWFQNKRCKDKKRQIAMKNMQQHQEKLQGGVPMVASSPVRHEPPQSMQAAPVEVQAYQAPWKALSEFAMGADIDQPPFQQLVKSFESGDMRSEGHLGLSYPPHLKPEERLCYPPASDHDGSLSELSSPTSL